MSVLPSNMDDLRFETLSFKASSSSMVWKMELNTIYEGFIYVSFFQSATFKGNEPAIETELKQPQTITQTSGVST